eukprot:3077422-Rhodomonas_salina.1
MHSTLARLVARQLIAHPTSSAPRTYFFNRTSTGLRATRFCCSSAGRECPTSVPDSAYQMHSNIARLVARQLVGK